MGSVYSRRANAAKKIIAAVLGVAINLSSAGVAFAQSAHVDATVSDTQNVALAEPDTVTEPTRSRDSERDIPRPSESPAPEDISPSTDVVQPAEVSALQNVPETTADADKKVVEEPPQTESMSSGVPGDLTTAKTDVPYRAGYESGALVYSYPLTLPPGRNKLQPRLELTYSNQHSGEDVLFGQGWSISIPFIKRENRNGTERMHSDNHFYSSLSGELATTSATSTFVAKSDDGSFLSYTFQNNRWVVVDKQGIQYIFGSTTAERQDDPGDSARIYKWMLTELRDTNGNFITYQYYKDAGQIYPSSITYTGSGVTAGVFQVDFTRTARSDNKLFSAFAGFPVQTNYQISEIAANVNGSWVKKYALSTSTGVTGNRLLLAGITESGRDSGGSTVTLPAMTFGHATSTKGWTQDENWTLPVPVTTDATGFYFLDVNGDALPDIIRSYDFGGGTQYNDAFLNNADGTWTNSTSTWALPIYLYRGGGSTNGAGFADINGDALPDIYESYVVGTTTTNNVWMNTGDGWSLSSTTLPLNMDSAYTSTYVLDVNGDGLTDFVRHIAYNPSLVFDDVYINNADGTWTNSTTTWAVPVDMGWDGTGMADLNGDGLVDVYHSNSGNNTGGPANKVWLNTGHGWALATDWLMPISFGGNKVAGFGARLEDVNGDGLTDVVNHVWYGEGNYHTDVHINNGDGTWDTETDWNVPVYTTLVGVGFSDLNGDGLADEFQSDLESNNHVWLSNNRPTDILARANLPQGGAYNFAYQATPRYKDASGDLLNPKLPYLLHTLSAAGYDNGLGVKATTTYEYHGGTNYFASSLNHRLGGFAKVAETDPDSIVTSYFHQGNTSSTTLGEYNDSYGKIGKPYRIETANASGTLYQLAINKWDEAQTVPGASFPFLAQTVDLSYDGQGTHRDRATSFTYSTTTGNLTERKDWGEVTGSTDGTFSDTGTDIRTTTIAYASSGGSAVKGAPSDEVTVDQSATKVKQTRHYYDNLSLGSVGLGNETKTEQWKSGSSYASTTHVFNSYGLVTQSKDGKGNATSYTYDPYNLFIATSTNDTLSQSTGYTYDYGSGKAATTTDPNGLITATAYDGLGRPVLLKQPDLTTPSALVTKSSFTYVDNTLPTSVRRTDYLNSATSTDTYQYFDGLGRLIQERKTAETSGTFTARDTVYGTNGLKSSESLPYFSANSSYTSPTTTTQLFTAYAYDALRRPNKITNAVGSTTNLYTPWKVTTTDPNGSVHDYLKDAFENLVQVNEYNGTSTYATYYTYDALSNLTKITDALGNVRNFTYDGLSRRLTAQDLHAPADGTFGAWTYSYDDASNLSQSVDPNNQTINYGYDALNRVTTEDYTGGSGTEITYTYDSCTYGKPRLCVASTTDARMTYQYNALGLRSAEAAAIIGAATTTMTSYEYDRQGNQTLITYPDNSAVRYGYDDRGFLDTVARRSSPSGNFATAISALDYAPTGAIARKHTGSGAITTYTYDPAQLYRLTNILTVASSTGSGEGLLGMMSMSSESGWQAKDAAQFAAAENSYEESQHAYKVALKPKDVKAGETSVELLKERPEIRLKKWNGEVDLGVSYSKVRAAASRAAGEKLVAWKGDKEEVHAYPLDPAEGMEDGGFEIEVFLKEKPVTNVFDFTIDGADDLDFFYQPALTEEEIAAGTQRPENVVGSYAVYHKTKKDFKAGGVNYATGKVFHVFRPKAIDAKGVETWAQLAYADGTLSVTVPQEFLDTASYPVRVDPTFGYTSAGASSHTGYNADIAGSLFTTPSDLGTVDSISGYFNQAAGGANAKLLVVLHSNLNIVSNGITSGVDVASNGWYSPTFSTAPTLSANTEYVLGYITDGTRAYVMYDSGVTDQGHYDASNNYNSPTNPTDASHNTDKYSIYVTYTVSGNQAPTAPSALLAEGQTNPSDIADPTPELSAIYNDPDSGDLAIHYRIQVATSSGFTSTVWDSGTTTMATTTAGTRSPDISYAGSALASSTTYYWRIAFSDDSGATGAWSTTTATFSLAAGGAGGGEGSDTVLQDINYAYDAVGNITSIIDRSATGVGKTLVFGYDALHRLISASTTAASSTPFLQTYAYNAIGNLTNKSDVGPFTYAGTNYANPHAPTTINGAAYAYDNNGNRTSGSGWTYGWNYRDRLASSGNGTATTTYAYDHENQRVKKTEDSTTAFYPNKYFDIAGATTTVHLYLPGGSLIAEVETVSSSGGGSATSTGFKTAGAIVQSTGFTNFTTTRLGSSDNSYATSQTTNPVGRISTFGFDIPAGATIDGVEVTVEAKVAFFTVDIPVSLSWDNGTSFTSTISKTITTTETVHTYGSATSTWGRTWTPSELGTSTFQVKIDPPTSAYTISYDQIRAKVFYTPAGGGATATTTRYVFGDLLDSTTVVTDASSTVVQVLDYYPYGTKRIDSGTSATDRQYIGERFDASTNLSYLNARYLDSQRGQFTSQDPMFWSHNQNLLNPQSLNSYSYANGNPIANKDPDGKAAVGVMAVPVAIGAGVTLPAWGTAALIGGGIALTAYGAYSLYDSFRQPDYQTTISVSGQGYNLDPKFPFNQPRGPWGPLITTTIGTGLVFKWGVDILEPYQKQAEFASSLRVANQLQNWSNNSSNVTVNVPMYVQSVQQTQRTSAPTYTGPSSNGTNPNYASKTYRLPNGAISDWGGNIIVPTTQPTTISKPQ